MKGGLDLEFVYELLLPLLERFIGESCVRSMISTGISIAESSFYYGNDWIDSHYGN